MVGEEMAGRRREELGEMEEEGQWRKTKKDNLDTANCQCDVPTDITFAVS